MCDVHYISDQKIKTTRDQITTQSNFPVSNFVLLKLCGHSSLWLLLVNMKCHHIIVSLPARASEQGNVIGLESVYIYTYTLYICVI